MKLQPDWKLLRHFSIALDRQCFSSDLPPIHVPEIKPDKDSNIAANGQIDGISWILEAYVDAGPFENQPPDAQCRSAPGNAREFEADDHATPRQRADVHAFARSPHQQTRIQIVGGEPIAGMR